MSTTIPDLWSDDIRVDVLSPLVILRSQEDLLSRKTKGILEAKVTTASNDAWVQHQLDLIAPALNHYRKTLLTAKHALNMVYPVTVTAECFIPKHKNSFQQFAESIQSPFEPPANQREADTQEEFIELVRQVLRSGEVRSLIQSLIAQSNEIRAADPSTDQTPSDSASPPPASTSENGTDGD